MRISRLLLPIAAALAALAAAATVSAASPPMSTGYVWAQPWLPALVSPFSQLPAWIVLTPEVKTVAELPILTTYPWAQPGSAPVHVTYGQPWSL